MAEIIAFISRKGGDGKTTTAQCIGGELIKQGAKVLFIDLDAQMNLTAATGARLTGYSVAHLLDNAKPAETIQHTRNGDIIAGSASLVSADLVIHDDNELKRAIRPLLREYDYIIIDCPANYGKLTRNALAAATSAIITARAASFSQQGLASLKGIVNQMQIINPVLKLRGIIITDYGARSTKAKQKLTDLKETATGLKIDVIEPPVRHTDKVGESQDEQINLTDYAPKCAAAKDYKDIVYKILNW